MLILLLQTKEAEKAGKHDMSHLHGARQWRHRAGGEEKDKRRTYQ